jgi:Rod binding domain-containing protein
MAVLHALASPAALASAAPPLPDAAGAAAAAPRADLNSKARSAAVDFEAQFLNSMFSQMLAGIQGDGPFGGGQAVGVWRSFLSEQYAKSFAKAGGIGIADHVYHALLAQQEAHAR